MCAKKSVAAKNYQLIEQIPAVEEFNDVRKAAGLKPKDVTAAKRGLSRSLYSVCVLYDTHVVGIGRIIGDGGLCFDIVDVAVRPEHQGKGLGKLIMESLMKFIHSNALPTAFIALMTEEKMVKFYEKYGFKIRGPSNPGMYQIIS